MASLGLEKCENPTEANELKRRYETLRKHLSGYGWIARTTGIRCLIYCKLQRGQLLLGLSVRFCVVCFPSPGELPKEGKEMYSRSHS